MKPDLVVKKGYAAEKKELSIESELEAIKEFTPGQKKLFLRNMSESISWLGDYTHGEDEPILYKGIRFENPLHATWGAFFDRIDGWEWEYDPVLGKEKGFSFDNPFQENKKPPHFKVTRRGGRADAESEIVYLFNVDSGYSHTQEAGLPALVKHGSEIRDDASSTWNEKILTVGCFEKKAAVEINTEYSNSLGSPVLVSFFCDKEELMEQASAEIKTIMAAGVECKEIQASLFNKVLDLIATTDDLVEALSEGSL